MNYGSFDDYCSVPVNFNANSITKKQNIGTQYSQQRKSDDVETQTKEDDFKSTSTMRDYSKCDILNFLEYSVPIITSELEKVSLVNGQTFNYSMRSCEDKCDGIKDTFFSDDDGTNDRDVANYRFGLSWSLSKVNNAGPSTNHTSSANEQIGFEVTSIAWSSNELIIGVGYGINEQHQYFFNHNDNFSSYNANSYGQCSKGAICFWDLSSHYFNPNSPNCVIHHTSSITTFSAHPENQSIFAAGTYHGEVSRLQCYTCSDETIIT